MTKNKGWYNTRSSFPQVPATWNFFRYLQRNTLGSASGPTLGYAGRSFYNIYAKKDGKFSEFGAGVVSVSLVLPIFATEFALWLTEGTIGLASAAGMGLKNAAAAELRKQGYLEDEIAKILEVQMSEYATMATALKTVTKTNAGINDFVNAELKDSPSLNDDIAILHQLGMIAAASGDEKALDLIHDQFAVRFYIAKMIEEDSITNQDLNDLYSLRSAERLGATIFDGIILGIAKKDPEKAQKLVDLFNREEANLTAGTAHIAANTTAFRTLVGPVVRVAANDTIGGILERRHLAIQTIQPNGTFHAPATVGDLSVAIDQNNQARLNFIADSVARLPANVTADQVRDFVASFNGGILGGAVAANQFLDRRLYEDLLNILCLAIDGSSLGREERPAGRNGIPPLEAQIPVSAANNATANLWNFNHKDYAVAVAAPGTNGFITNPADYRITQIQNLVNFGVDPSHLYKIIAHHHPQVTNLLPNTANISDADSAKNHLIAVANAFRIFGPGIAEQILQDLVAELKTKNYDEAQLNALSAKLKSLETDPDVAAQLQNNWSVKFAIEAIKEATEKRKQEISQVKSANYAHHVADSTFYRKGGLEKLSEEFASKKTREEAKNFAGSLVDGETHRKVTTVVDLNIAAKLNETKNRLEDELLVIEQLYAYLQKKNAAGELGCTDIASLGAVLTQVKKVRKELKDGNKNPDTAALVAAVQAANGSITELRPSTTNPDSDKLSSIFSKPTSDGKISIDLVLGKKIERTPGDAGPPLVVAVNFANDNNLTTAAELTRFLTGIHGKLNTFTTSAEYQNSFSDYEKASTAAQYFYPDQLNNLAKALAEINALAGTGVFTDTEAGITALITKIKEIDPNAAKVVKEATDKVADGAKIDEAKTVVRTLLAIAVKESIKAKAVSTVPPTVIDNLGDAAYNDIANGAHQTNATAIISHVVTQINAAANGRVNGAETISQTNQIAAEISHQNVLRLAKALATLNQLIANGLDPAVANQKAKLIAQIEKIDPDAARVLIEVGVNNAVRARTAVKDLLAGAFKESVKIQAAIDGHNIDAEIANPAYDITATINDGDIYPTAILKKITIEVDRITNNQVQTANSKTASALFTDKALEFAKALAHVNFLLRTAGFTNEEVGAANLAKALQNINPDVANAITSYIQTERAAGRQASLNGAVTVVRKAFSDTFRDAVAMQNQNNIHVAAFNNIANNITHENVADIINSTLLEINRVAGTLPPAPGFADLSQSTKDAAGVVSNAILQRISNAQDYALVNDLGTVQKQNALLLQFTELLKDPQDPEFKNKADVLLMMFKVSLDKDRGLTATERKQRFQDFVETAFENAVKEYGADRKDIELRESGGTEVRNVSLKEYFADNAFGLEKLPDHSDALTYIKHKAGKTDYNPNLSFSKYLSSNSNGVVTVKTPRVANGESTRSVTYHREVTDDGYKEVCFKPGSNTNLVPENEGLIKLNDLLTSLDGPSVEKIGKKFNVNFAYTEDLFNTIGGSETSANEDYAYFQNKAYLDVGKGYLVEVTFHVRDGYGAYSYNEKANFSIKLLQQQNVAGNVGGYSEVAVATGIEGSYITWHETLHADKDIGNKLAELKGYEFNITARQCERDVDDEKLKFPTDRDPIRLNIKAGKIEQGQIGGKINIDDRGKNYVFKNDKLIFGIPAGSKRFSTLYAGINQEAFDNAITNLLSGDIANLAGGKEIIIDLSKSPKIYSIASLPVLIKELRDKGYTIKEIKLDGKLLKGSHDQENREALKEIDKILGGKLVIENDNSPESLEKRIATSKAGEVLDLSTYPLKTEEISKLAKCAVENGRKVQFSKTAPWSIFKTEQFSEADAFKLVLDLGNAKDAKSALALTARLVEAIIVHHLRADTVTNENNLNGLHKKFQTDLAATGANFEQVVKNFQESVFDQFLQGNSRELPYRNRAACQNINTITPEMEKADFLSISYPISGKEAVDKLVALVVRNKNLKAIRFDGVISEETKELIDQKLDEALGKPGVDRKVKSIFEGNPNPVTHPKTVTQVVIRENQL